jgi:hypothetical protein
MELRFYAIITANGLRAGLAESAKQAVINLAETHPKDGAPLLVSGVYELNKSELTKEELDEICNTEYNIISGGTPEYPILFMKDAGPKKLRIVKTLKNRLNVSLKDAKLMVDSVPITLNTLNMTPHQIETLYLELTSYDADVIKHVDQQNQEKPKSLGDSVDFDGLRQQIKDVEQNA